MTTPLLRPFPAYIPAEQHIESIVAPPVSSITTDRYAQLVEDNPDSILHLLGSAIDTGEGGSDPSLFDRRGAARLQQMIDQAKLEAQPEAFYILQIDTGTSTHTGIVCEVHTDGVADGRIKRHEHTRAETEELVVDHLNIVGAHTDPVAMTYRARPELQAAVQAVIANREPLRDFTADDGSEQRLWAIADAETIRLVELLLTWIPAVYITDGHHRTAAAARLAARRAESNPDHAGTEPYNYVLAVLFAEDELALYGYNRAVMSLDGIAADDVVDRIGELAEVDELAVTYAEEARPRSPGVMAMFVGDRWYRVRFREDDIPTDPRDSLDAVLLQELILGPVLGITDARSDSRLHYVPGPAGLAALEHSGAAIAFGLHAASVADVMAVADAGQVMPPKSTWFSPKILTGLIVRRI